MSPLIIALVVLGIVAVTVSIFGWKWHKARQHQKIVEKHDELFRAVFPDGIEQQAMARPLLQNTLQETDDYLQFLKDVKRRLETKAFTSPLGVGFGLQLHSDLLALVTATEDKRRWVIKIGNKSGLGFVEEPEGDEDDNTPSAPPARAV